MADRYERERDDKAHTEWHCQQRTLDEEWRMEEIRVQQAWIDRPFYRQLWFPPAPDYTAR